jgi:hypothetical protein
MDEIKEKQFKEGVKITSDAVTPQGIYSNAYFSLVYKLLYNESIKTPSQYSMIYNLSSSSVKSPLVSLVLFLLNILEDEIQNVEKYFPYSVLIIIDCLFNLLFYSLRSPLVTPILSYSVKASGNVIPSFTIKISHADILFCLIFPKLSSILINVMRPNNNNNNSFSSPPSSSLYMSISCLSFSSLLTSGCSFHSQESKTREEIKDSFTLIPSIVSSVDLNGLRLSVIQSLLSLNTPFSFGRSLFGEWYVKHTVIDDEDNPRVLSSVHIIITSSPPEDSSLRSTTTYCPIFKTPSHLYQFSDMALCILYELISSNMPTSSVNPVFVPSLQESCIELLNKIAV